MAYGTYSYLHEMQQDLQPLGQEKQDEADAMSAITKHDMDKAYSALSKVPCDAEKAQEGLEKAADATAVQATKDLSDGVLPELNNSTAEAAKKIITDTTIDAASGQNSDNNNTLQPKADPDMQLRPVEND